jgi:menaquinol-cytochrome c reductase iron-sulfur subunit
MKVGSAWVVNRGSKLVAFTTVCPHLGCAIDWASAERKFKCPCHRSAFGLDGKVEAGPSLRGMDELELSKDKEGLLSIRYRRFKQGILAKEPV